MKKLLQYTAWDWSMGRGPAGTLLGLGSVAECVLLVAAAGMAHNAWSSYDELVVRSGLLWVAVIVYIALPVCTRLDQIMAGKRSKSEFATLTLPFPRWQIFAVRTISTGLWLVVGAAVQLVLLAILWGPVTALQDSVAFGYFWFDVTAQGRIWWDLAECELFRLLLPTNLTGTIIWMGLILAPSLMAASVVSHGGWRQMVAGILALTNQAVLAMLVFSLTNGSTSMVQLEASWSNPMMLTIFAVMAAVVVLLSLWGLFALQRSESAA